MKSSRLPLSLLVLLPLLAACTSSPEYPGFTTNVHIGGTRVQSNLANGRPVTTPQSSPSLVHTQPAQAGGQAVCVGTWCSCQTE